VYQSPESNEVKGTINIIAQQTRSYTENRNNKSQKAKNNAQKVYKINLREDLLPLLKHLKEKS
jgi:hypothetical protein